MKRSLLLATASAAGAEPGKRLIDHATLPRMWLEAAPHDPKIPIRGRYVELGVRLPASSAVITPIVFFIPEHAPIRLVGKKRGWCDRTACPQLRGRRLLWKRTERKFRKFFEIKGAANVGA
jgi:hypothetical protein